MMAQGPQYNERSILQRFFNSKHNGFVLEVGAADGISNSHTEFLIREWGWSAVLIEPHPSFADALAERYQENEKVRLSRLGVLAEAGVNRFYLHKQISRFLSDAS